LPTLIIALVVAWFSTFTVDERQLAILLRLGEIKAYDYKPGLHFKFPLIDSVKKFQSRLLSLDAEPERFLTSEKKAVIVDYFVKWRISDVGAYYKSTGGDERKAAGLLAQQINDNLRGEFGKRTVQQVISGQRGDVMDAVTQAARERGRDFGISVVDVRTKRIDLPGEVSNAVYERMRAERERVARDFRSRGAEGAEIIRANADKERTIVLAEAYRESEKIRGEGDAQAAGIYAQAFGKNAEFYAFYRSINAYKNSFGSSKDLLIVEPNSDFFKYFKDLSPNHSPAAK
jgi:membrane protease subunit HflC